VMLKGFEGGDKHPTSAVTVAPRVWAGYGEIAWEKGRLVVALAVQEAGKGRLGGNL